jgi:hypothetical protein
MVRRVYAPERLFLGGDRGDPDGAGGGCDAMLSAKWDEVGNCVIVPSLYVTGQVGRVARSVCTQDLDVIGKKL